MNQKRRFSAPGIFLAAGLVFGVIGCERRGEDFDNRIHEYRLRTWESEVEIDRLGQLLEEFELGELLKDDSTAAREELEELRGKSCHLVVETWIADREEFGGLRQSGQTGQKLRESLEKSDRAGTGLKSVMARRILLVKSRPAVIAPGTAPSGAGPVFDTAPTYHPAQTVKTPDALFYQIDIRDETFTVKPSSEPDPNSRKTGGPPIRRELPYGKALYRWIVPPALENGFGGVDLYGIIGSFRENSERFWLVFDYTSRRALPPRPMELSRENGQPSRWRLYLPDDSSNLEMRVSIAIEMGEMHLLGAAPFPPPDDGSCLVVLFGRLLEG